MLQRYIYFSKCNKKTKKMKIQPNERDDEVCVSLCADMSASQLSWLATLQVK